LYGAKNEKNLSSRLTQFPCRKESQKGKERKGEEKLRVKSERHSQVCRGVKRERERESNGG